MQTRSLGLVRNRSSSSVLAKPKQRSCSLACVFFWLLGFLLLLSAAPWFLACTISPLSKELDTRWGIHTESPGSQILSSAGRTLLVTAHPDDEALFFGPTLTALKDQRQEVFILCLTNGNAHGLGAIRQRELLEAAAAFEVSSDHVKLINDTHLQDGHNTEWDPALIQGIVQQEVARNKIQTIVTFDPLGVTQHRNHVTINAAVRQYLAACTAIECPSGWQLVTSGRWQKYTSFLDTLPSSRSHRKPTACYLNRKLLRSYRAFKAHHSQSRWWTHMAFSRYTFVNQLERMQ